jgi:hypothetical protein
MWVIYAIVLISIIGGIGGLGAKGQFRNNNPRPEPWRRRRPRHNWLNNWLRKACKGASKNSWPHTRPYDRADYVKRGDYDDYEDI